jgi:hypothetical protein
MAQFQLIFKGADRPQWSEMRDTAGSEPYINGEPLVDGAVFAIRGDRWQAAGRRDNGDEDHTDFKRFLCTPTA